MAEKETKKKVRVLDARIKDGEGRKLTRSEMDLVDAQATMVANVSLIRRDMLNRFLNPGKNINYECGYPDSIIMQDYKDMYAREGMGTRVVKILPEESWAMPPNVYETEESNETEFEKAWAELEKEKHILQYLQRVDILSGIGEFGVLLLGISDGLELNQPVNGINLKTGEKAGKNKYKLLYLKPFDESSIAVKTKEVDVTSPRFGYPAMYTIDFEGETKSGTMQTQDVHWTRIIHVADNRHTSEILGIPRMKPVFNRLLDIRKIVAGSGEMFWKGAFPGYSFETRPEITDPLTKEEKDTIKEEFEAYSRGLQRFIALSGLNVKSLTPQVSDPKGHLESQLRYIAITLGIPYRVFLGTEEAKLASTQDVRTWNKRLNRRREGYITPMILRVFIDRLIIFGVLPEVKEYFVSWPDLNVMSEEDEAKVALTKTEAFTKYVAGGVDVLIPPKEFLMIIMGMEEKEAEAIMKAAEKHLEEVAEGEEEELPEEEEEEEDNV